MAEWRSKPEPRLDVVWNQLAGGPELLLSAQYLHDARIHKRMHMRTSVVNPKKIPLSQPARLNGRLRNHPVLQFSGWARGTGHTRTQLTELART